MRAAIIPTLLAALTLLSRAQTQLRGGVTAAQLEQIKPLIRAETWARITAVTMQRDGTMFVDTFDKCGYPAITCGVSRAIGKSIGRECTLRQIDPSDLTKRWS